MRPATKKIFASFILLVPFVTQAEGLRMYRSGEIPDSNDIAKMLSTESPTEDSKPKMRGISLDPVYNDKSSQARATKKSLEKVANPAPDGFALPVQFAFDSSRILPNATPQLDAVAEGIKMVKNAKVIVEGHTDAYGSDLYNESLSRRRAAEVKRYLVEKHGIDQNLLTIVGMGEWAPIDSNNPYSPGNRRVQFRAAK